MSGNKFVVNIGDEIEVTVLFEYEPAIEQTSTDPAWDATVLINEVLINGLHDKNIVSALNKKTINELEQWCWVCLEEEHSGGES